VKTLFCCCTIVLDGNYHSIFLFSLALQELRSKDFFQVRSNEEFRLLNKGAKNSNPFLCSIVTSIKLIDVINSD